MTTPTAKDVATIIGHVGTLVGKTKLQKTTALLELTGLGAGFTFSYYLYGPYSEELTSAVERAVLLGLVREEEKVAAWGGKYSVFHADKVNDPNPARAQLVQSAARANSVVLELAVTAIFLAANGEENPWALVSELKSEKASEENIAKAKELYRELAAIQTPAPLPELQ